MMASSEEDVQVLSQVRVVLPPGEQISPIRDEATATATEATATATATTTDAPATTATSGAVAVALALAGSDSQAVGATLPSPGSSSINSSSVGSPPFQSFLPVHMQLDVEGVVFLTGVTGFIGSVLLEQLLRQFPHIKIAVLMRPKRGASSQERLAKLMESALFDLLNAQHIANGMVGEGATRAQWAKTIVDQRLVVVHGDLTEQRSPLGLSDEDLEYLRTHCEYWVHSAASLSFTLPLVEALQHNYLPTEHIIALAASGEKTKGVIHLSTCYVAGAQDKGATIREDIYDDPTTSLKMQEAFQQRNGGVNWPDSSLHSTPGELEPLPLVDTSVWVDWVLRESMRESATGVQVGSPESKVTALERALLGGQSKFCNTYMFSKWLVEQSTRRWQQRRIAAYERAMNDAFAASSWDEASKIAVSAPRLFPVFIIRPSMVSCMSALGPLPGYLGNKSGGAGVHLVIGNGFMRFTANVPTQHIDFVPVDTVTSSIMLAMCQQRRVSMQHQQRHAQLRHQLAVRFHSHKCSHSVMSSPDNSYVAPTAGKPDIDQSNHHIHHHQPHQPSPFRAHSSVSPAASTKQDSLDRSFNAQLGSESQSSTSSSVATRPFNPAEFFQIFHSALGALNPLPNRVYVDECVRFYTAYPTEYVRRGGRNFLCQSKRIPLGVEWIKEDSISYRFKLAALFLPKRVLTSMLNMVGLKKLAWRSARLVDAMALAYTTQYDFGMTFLSDNVQKLITDSENDVKRESSSSNIAQVVSFESGKADAYSPVLEVFPALQYARDGMDDWIAYMELQCLGEQVFLLREKNPALRSMHDKAMSHSPLWQHMKEIELHMKSDEAAGIAESVADTSMQRPAAAVTDEASPPTPVQPTSSSGSPKEKLASIDEVEPTLNPTSSADDATEKQVQEKVASVDEEQKDESKSSSSSAVSPASARRRVGPFRAVSLSPRLLNRAGSLARLATHSRQASIERVKSIPPLGYRQTSLRFLLSGSEQIAGANDDEESDDEDSIQMPRVHEDPAETETEESHSVNTLTMMEEQLLAASEAELEAAEMRALHPPASASAADLEPALLANTAPCGGAGLFLDRTRPARIALNLLLDEHGIVGLSNDGSVVRVDSMSFSIGQSIKTCPKAARLLNGISFELRPGQLCCLAGTANSGKSLLIQLLADSYYRRSGELEGSLFVSPLCASMCEGDSSAVFSIMTVRETLVSVGRYHFTSEQQIRHPLELQSEQVLAALDLRHLAHRYVGGAFARSISSGESRRLRIALALMTRPRLLLLDDAVVGLDAQHALDLVSLLAHLCRTQQLTCIFAVKQLRVDPRIAQLSNMLLLLHRGQQVFFGDRAFAETAMMTLVASQTSDMVVSREESKQSSSAVISVSGSNSDLLVPEAEGDHLAQLMDQVRALPDEVDITAASLVAQTAQVLAKPPIADSAIITKTDTQSEKCAVDGEENRVLLPWLFQFQFLMADLVLTYRRDVRQLHTQMNLVAGFGLFLGLLLLQLNNSLADLQALNTNVIWLSASASLPVLFATFAILEEHASFQVSRRHGSYSLSAWFTARLLAQLPAAFVVVLPCTVFAFFISGFPQSAFGVVFAVCALCYLVGRSLACVVSMFSRTAVVCLLASQGLLIAGIAFVGGLIQKNHWPAALKWVPHIDHFYHAGNLILHAIISNRDWTCKLDDEGFGFYGNPGECRIAAYGNFPCVEVTEYVNCRVSGDDVLRVAFGIEPPFNVGASFGYLIAIIAVMQACYLILLLCWPEISRATARISNIMPGTKRGQRSAVSHSTAANPTGISTTVEMQGLPQVKPNATTVEALRLPKERDALLANSSDDDSHNLEFHFAQVILRPSRLRRWQAQLLESPLIAKLLGYPPPVTALATLSKAQQAVMDGQGPSSRARIVLTDVGSQLYTGTVIGLLGPSGAGKSTLLNALAGILPADEARVAGYGLQWSGGRNRPMPIAYVAHEEPYEPVLTVRESVRLTACCVPVLNLHGLNSVDGWCDFLIQALDLKTVAHTSMQDLSESQRLGVQVAVALSSSPRVLMLDEPLSLLSDADGARLLQQLRTLARQLDIAVLLTLHQPPPSLLMMLDQVIVVRAGCKHFDGTPAVLLGCEVPITAPTDLALVEEQRKTISSGENSSQHAAHIVDMHDECDDDEEDQVAEIHHSSASRLWSTLTRLTLTYVRSFSLLWVKLIMLLLSAVYVGLLYARLASTTEYVREFLSAFNFLMVFAQFSQIVAVVPMAELSITFVHALKNRRYTVTHWWMSHTLTSALTTALFSLATVAVAYWWIDFGSSQNFGQFWCAIFLLCFCVDGISACIGFGVPSALVASVLTAVLVSTFCVFDGFYLPVNNMPRWMLFISYASPCRYAYQILAASVLQGRTFINNPNASTDAERTTDGSFIFKTLVNDYDDYKISLDFGALVLYAVMLRILFLLQLYVKSASSASANITAAAQKATNSKASESGMPSWLRRTLQLIFVLATAAGVVVLVHASGDVMSSKSSGAVLIPPTLQEKEYASLPQSSTTSTAQRAREIDLFRTRLDYAANVHSAQLPAMPGNSTGMAIDDAEYEPLREQIYYTDTVLSHNRDRVRANLTLNSLDSYEHVYDYFEDLIDRPLAVKQWRSDRLFAKRSVSSGNEVYRLLSEAELAAILPNYMDHAAEFDAVLRNATVPPLDVSVSDATPFVSLLRSGKVYVVDYLRLSSVITIPGRYAAGALALFYFDSQKLPAPLCIVLRTATSEVWYTPLDGNGSAADGYDWLLAKMAFESTSVFVIEMRHFSENHQKWQPLRIAMHRQMHSSHPVSQLMLHHWNKLFGMTVAGMLDLFNQGNGVIFLSQAFSWNATLSEFIRWSSNYNFQDARLRNDLKARRMENTSADLYASDSLRLLEAIETFVSDYLDLFYTSDSDVVADTELQAMLAEVQQPLSVHGVPTRIEGLPVPCNTRVDLVGMLSHLIWSAAVQHHTRNTYSLWHQRWVLPAVPLALWSPLPTSKPAVRTEADMMRFMPDMDHTLAQVSLALDFAIPITAIDRLGQSYSVAGFSSRAAPLIDRFQTELDRISLATQKRNVVEGDMPFVFTDPRFLPHYQLI